MKYIILLVLLIGATGLGWEIFTQLKEQKTKSKKSNQEKLPIPVEVAWIEQGPMELKRTFSGTLEAWDELIIAPKISGRIKRLHVDFADTVKRGQVVAELDNDEYIQSIAQAKAFLAVAQANLNEATRALEVAVRELNRIERLRKDNLLPESDFDSAKANEITKEAQLEVTKARLLQAESELEIANIRLRYTQIVADWIGGDNERVVAERYVNEGETVSANTSLLYLVELSPITGVIYVTEKDYSLLKPEQSAFLTTDAYPGEKFPGKIGRISPIFQKNTRQVRVELIVENSEQKLRPGMFVRVNLILKQIPKATIVPDLAITLRNDQTGIFVLQEETQTVQWHPVTLGIQDGERLQIREVLKGRVVTLGQQLLNEGVKITIPSVSTNKKTSQEKADPQ